MNQRRSAQQKKRMNFMQSKCFLPKLHMPSWMVCFGQAGAFATNGLSINFSNRDNNRHVGTFIVGIFHRQKKNERKLFRFYPHTENLKAHFHTKTIMETHMPWDNAYIETHQPLHCIETFSIPLLT